MENTTFTDWNDEWLNNSTSDFDYDVNDKPRALNLVFLDTQFIFSLIVSSFAFPGNILLVLVILFSPQLHNVTYFLLAHLSMMDATLVLVILLVHWDSTSTNHLVWCNAVGPLITLCYGLKSWSLVVVCFDQYIWINKPLRYYKLMTKKHTCMLLGSVWSLTVFVMCLPLMIGENYKFNKKVLSCTPHPNKIIQVINFLYCILIPIAIASKYYLQVAKEIWKRKHQRVLICNTVNCSYERRSKLDFKIINCLLLTGGLYIGCWIPGLVTAVLTLTGVPVSRYIQLILQPITCLSIAIVPIVQYRFNSTLRRATIRLWNDFWAIFRRNRTVDVIEYGLQEGTGT